MIDKIIIPLEKEKKNAIMCVMTEVKINWSCWNIMSIKGRKIALAMFENYEREKRVNGIASCDLYNVSLSLLQ